MQLALVQGLREILLSVLEDSPSEEQVARLVHICHALAHPFVASKFSGSMNAFLTMGLSASDIAYDCVGDLFRRDAKGNLVQVQAYFDAVEISRVTETELLMHLRRLVFSAVNQGVYRLYRQADPAFGKILRNIKLAVATVQNFVEIDRFGETYLVPAMADPLLGCPPFELDRLERSLTPMVNSNLSIPSLLAALSMLLRQQREYSRAVPLTAVALLFRSVYAQGQTAQDEQPGLHDELMQKQVRDVIRRAAEMAIERMSPEYRRDTRWSEELAGAYQRAIERNLVLRLLPHDGEDSSYYAGLCTFLPDLTREEYRALHRNKLEYMGRLAYEILVSELREDLQK